MTFERGLDIEAKMAAIGAQSPKLPPETVRRTAEREVEEGKAIWGAIDFKVNWYPVEGASSELMDQWRNEVTELLSDLTSGVEAGDLRAFVEKSKGSLSSEYIWSVVGAVKGQAEALGIEFDNEARNLLAIDLWIRREQGGRWKSETLRRTAWKVLTGQGSHIADVLDRDEAPNCVDVGFLVKAMAEQFGAKGEVKSMPSTTPGIDHRYFETASGKVLDYWWLPKSGGLALTADLHKKEVAKRRGDGHGHPEKKIK